MIRKLLTWLKHNMDPETTTPTETPVEESNLNVQDGFGTYHN